MNALQTTVAERIVSTSAMTDRQRKAHEIGAILAADAAFVAEVSAQAQRKDESKVSAAQLCLYVGGDLDRQQIMSIPDPGSDEDKYDTEEGKGRGSYIWDMASDLPDAIQVIKHLNWITEAGKTGIQYSPDNPFTGKTKVVLSSERAYWSGRKLSVKNVVSDCVWLAKCLLLANALDGIKAEIRDDGQGSILKNERGKTPVVQCIKVEDTTDKNHENWKYMSVGSFLALDTTQIKADDLADKTKHYKAFIATGNRGKKGDGEKSTAGQLEPTIKSMDKSLEYAAELVAYYDQETDAGRKHTAELLKYMANPKVGDDVVETIYALSSVFDRVSTVIEKRAIAIQEKKAAAIAA